MDATRDTTSGIGETFRIGTLGKPHGVRGELSFHFDDDVFDRVDADFLFVEIDGLPVPFFLEEYRFRSDEVALVKFDSIDTEEQAAGLTGCAVLFPRDLVDDDSEDATVSKAEIIGFEVIDAADGKSVGRIEAVDDSTVNTLFDVATSGGSVLIPASHELITAIDRQARTITLSIPQGLLTLD